MVEILDRPIKPDDVKTSEIPKGELNDIVEQINARMLGEVSEPHKLATKDEDAIRQNEDFQRKGVLDIDGERINLIQRPFIRDVQRILYSKAYERLANKTQVCAGPVRAHITNRQIHSQRVASVARSFARALGVNEDLTEAIALGHDLGHAPFGHRGEVMISQGALEFDPAAFAKVGQFKHNIQSVNVTDRVATRRGHKFPELNLTDQVRHGILTHDGERNSWSVGMEALPKEELHPSIINYMKATIAASAETEYDPKLRPHDVLLKKLREIFESEGEELSDDELIQRFKEDSGQEKAKDMKLKKLDDFNSVEARLMQIQSNVSTVTVKPATLEACAVFIADTLHYMPEDYSDMLSLGVTTPEHLPPEVVTLLGENSGDMINRMITDVLIHSHDKGFICYSNEFAEMLSDFKYKFLYRRYGIINSWLEDSSSNSAVKLNTGDFPLNERMQFLLNQYMTALENPWSHPDSSIVKGYMQGRDMNRYKDKMTHIDSDAHLLQIAIDYIAGFTDDFFFQESNKIAQ